jgi:hypothetical protein
MEVLLGSSNWYWPLLLLPLTVLSNTFLLFICLCKLIPALFAQDARAQDARAQDAATRRHAHHSSTVLPHISRNSPRCVKQQAAAVHLVV